MPPPASTPNSHLVFHHFGLAVRRPDESRTFLLNLGYRIGETVFDPNQNVQLAMCEHPTEPAVEIIWPGETKGPILSLTQRHTSGIIYHVCYTTDNLAAALAGLERAGLNVICVSPPKPAPLFGGRPVSFYNVVGMGLIEILE
jgi:Glyoxalase/Bleomycin resistance protein/Dioxygenase superfamily